MHPVVLCCASFASGIRIQRRIVAFMDKNTRFCKLEIPLRAGDYGRSAQEVLETCALVAEYAQEHTPDQVKAFQEKVEINPQVWLRLLALHRDERLKKHLEHLPASYTALYAIHRMKDEEIDAAVQQGVITPSASSHAILSWAKQNRQRSGQGIPPWRCVMVFDQEIDKKEHIAMRWRINEVLQEYGARLMSEWDYIQEDSAKDSQGHKVIKELESKINALSAPIFEAMTESERTKAEVSSHTDFLQMDLASLGFATRPAYDRVSKMRRHSYSGSYVYRIALEFQKTDSRSQRFNYKRRLKQLAEKQPELKELIDEVLETYMVR
jgi:hypothetical protein